MKGLYSNGTRIHASFPPPFCEPLFVHPLFEKADKLSSQVIGAAIDRRQRYFVLDIELDMIPEDGPSLSSFPSVRRLRIIRHQVQGRTGSWPVLHRARAGMRGPWVAGPARSRD